MTGLLPLLDALSLTMLAPMLGVAAVNVLGARRLANAAPAPSGTRVSLLIPARDEAQALRDALPAIGDLPELDLEILVLDDGSEDGTAAVVAGRAAADSRVRLVGGAPLPPGWLGKNWACHQLAAEAAGDHLLFCDADVVASAEAVARTAGILVAGADAVTAFPRHRLGGWVEAAVVPLVTQLPILALLPLPLVARSRLSGFSVGNGQWLAFRRETYVRIGGHAAVRAEVLEDMALARRVKEDGGRLAALPAGEGLSVRMYRTPAEVVEGFSKNLYPLLGSSPFGLAAGLAIFYLVAVHPLAAAVLPGGGFAPLTLLAALRLLGMAGFGHPAASVLAHPLGAILVPYLAVRSAVRVRRGTATWRGRILPASPGGVRKPPPVPRGPNTASGTGAGEK